MGFTALLVLAAFAALWLALRPALRRLPPERRGLAEGGGLAVAALILFALRLAPFGIVALILAGGALVSAFTRSRSTLGFDLGEDVPPPHRSTGMGRAEALEVLGLNGSPSAEEVDAAHRRMIVLAHPDRGGSDYLAAKINAAREALRR